MAIWENRNFPSWLSSIFSMFSNAPISAASPSSMPEETTIPSYRAKRVLKLSRRSGVPASRWRKAAKLES